MKKWMSLGLCVLLLLSLTACGETPLTEEANYRYGMEQLELGNLAKAYGYFQDSTDPRAAEMLEKFVFVPTTVTRKSSNGRDMVHTYTYDERGNLRSEADKGDSNWYYETDTEIVYTYDEQNRLLSQTYRDFDYTYRETYTYDEKGNELTYSYFNGEGETPFSGYVCTYDERGNLLKKEEFDGYDAAYNCTYTYTYDEQDRALTCTITQYDGDRRIHYYTHEEDGSYRYYFEFVDSEGDTYTYAYWYDSEGRAQKNEVYNKTTDEIYESYEYQRDEQGNEIYRRYVYDGDETVRTTTYNERGQELVSETKENGETYSMYTHTYNEAGEPLSYEYFYGDSSWGRTAYTYDAQNRLLSKKKMSNHGWNNLTYTYDEAGNMVKVENDGNNEDFVCEYTYDAYGNALTCDCNAEDNEGGLSAGKNTAQWKLQYYPDGIPDDVRFVITEVEEWFNYE